MKKGSDSSALLVSILLALIALATSLAFPPIQQIRDSLTWAKEVEQGTNLYQLLNPHHLGYLPAIRALFVVLRKACPSCSGVDAAQVFGLASSVIAAVALFHLTRRLAASTFVAAGLVLALIFSRTFWVFSMQVSPYVPTVAALALLALMVVTRGERLHNDKGTMLATSGAYAVAVLFHQAAVLIGFAVAAYLFASCSRRDAWRTLLWIAICSGGVVLITYIVAFVAIFGAESMSLGEFVKYLNRYGSTNTPGFASLSNLSLEGLELSLQAQFETFMLAPWSHRFAALFPFGALLLLLIGWNAFRAASGDRLGVRVFFLSWLTIMFALVLWEDPNDAVKKTLDLVPILALVSLAVGDSLGFARRNRQKIVMQGAVVASLLVVVMLFAVRNFEDAVGPLHSSLGKKYEKASLIAEVAPKQCTIVEGYQEVLMNLYYYFDRAGLDAWDLMTWFHFGKANKLPFTWEKFRFSDHDCIFIDAEYLNPTIPIHQRSAPDRWYAYIEWLLGFDYERGRVSSTRCMSSVVDSRGSRYLVINLHERCDAAGLEAVVRELDAHLGATDGQHGVAVFSEWLAQHRGAVPGFSQRRFRDVLSDVSRRPAHPLARGPTTDYRFASSDRRYEPTQRLG